MGIESCDRGGFSGLGARRLTAKVKLGFDLREGEGYGMGVAVQGEGVDPWASGIAQTEEFGDFVEGFAGGTSLVEEDGMDVPLKMVDGDERDVLRVGEGLCVDDADEEGSGKAWT